MNKGEITLIAVIGGAVGVLGLLSTMFWGGHKLVIEPIKEDVEQIKAEADEDREKLTAALLDVAVIKENVKSTNDKVDWFVRLYGYKEPRESISSTISTLQ